LNTFKNTSKLSPFNPNKKPTVPSIKSAIKYNPNSPINTYSNPCPKNSVSTSKPKSKINNKTFKATQNKLSTTRKKLSVE